MAYGLGRLKTFGISMMQQLLCSTESIRRCTLTREAVGVIQRVNGRLSRLKADGIPESSAQTQSWMTLLSIAVPDRENIDLPSRLLFIQNQHVNKDNLLPQLSHLNPSSHPSPRSLLPSEKRMQYSKKSVTHSMLLSQSGSKRSQTSIRIITQAPMR